VRERDPIEPACKRWRLATLAAAALVGLVVVACYPVPRQRWVGIDGRTIGVNQETGADPEKTEANEKAPPQKQAGPAPRCVIDSPRGKETLLLRTRDAWSAVRIEGGPDGPDPEATPELDGVRIPDGSRCELLEYTEGLARIRVLDGPLASADGWVDVAALSDIVITRKNQ
jgi:hypothetical protein